MIERFYLQNRCQLLLKKKQNKSLKTLLQTSGRGVGGKDSVFFKELATRILTISSEYMGNTNWTCSFFFFFVFQGQGGRRQKADLGGVGNACGLGT